MLSCRILSGDFTRRHVLISITLAFTLIISNVVEFHFNLFILLDLFYLKTKFREREKVRVLMRI